MITSIHCYVKHYSHISFFRQVLDCAYVDLNKKYFTDNFFLYLYVKYVMKESIIFVPLFLYRKVNSNDISLSEREKLTLNWEIQYMVKSRDHVIKRFVGLKNWFADQVTPNERVLGFCWSGNNTESLAFANAIKEKGGSVFFGEITNYPNTVYLDKEGTNYFSEMAKNLQYVAQEITTVDAAKELREMKLSQKKLPQSSMKLFNKFFLLTYGIQQFCFARGKRFSIWYALLRRLETIDSRMNRLISSGEFIDVDTWVQRNSTLNKKKVLIPLQVNHDTQLHVFSPFRSSFEFMKKILELSDSSFEIDIKLHPAELLATNKLTTKLINKVHHKNPTIRLVDKVDISDYDYIVTINSTFGIDALLSGVKVICFGKSIYSDLDFVLNYNKFSFNSLSEACNQYEEIVDSSTFNSFSAEIQTYFYHFNYFSDAINTNVSEQKLERSMIRLKEESELLFNDNK